MQRRDPWQPSEPAGYNPAGLTQGFYFKIIPQVTAAPGTSSFLDKSALSAPMTNPSRTQPSAAATSAAAAKLQSAGLGATSNAGIKALASNDPASSRPERHGALPRASVPRQNDLEAFKGGLPQSKSISSSPAPQTPNCFSHTCLEPAPDSILDRPQQSAGSNPVAISYPPLFQAQARGPRGVASGPSSGVPLRAISTDRLQQRLDAMYAQNLRMDAILHASRQDMQAVRTDIFHNRQTCAAEEDCELREQQQHRQDVLAFQAE